MKSPVLLPLAAAMLLPALAAQSPFPLQQYGSGGCGIGDYVPTFHTGGEFPLLGNAHFQVLSRNLRGQVPGVLFLSTQPAYLSLLGMTILVNPLVSLGLPCQADGTAGLAGAGMVQAGLPIPNLASLAGSDLYLQGFFLDSTIPVTLVHTQGLHLNFRQSFSKEVRVLYDRVNYQAHFQGVTATQADQLGRAIWSANGVYGFSYLRTRQFTCGGQSHWVVVVKDDAYGIEFMLIPGGSFRMGDIQNTGGKEELPVHRVHLEPFLLARTEVTQGNYQAVMKSAPWQGRSYVGPSSVCSANWLTWNEAAVFCNRLGCRLPSASEWEYACRAGTETCHNFGANYPSGNLRQYAWYRYSVTGSYPHQAGVLLPNAFGLHDMHGNVNEWCQDRWHPDHRGAPTNGQAWESGSSGNRVIRCGDFGGLPYGCRSARRYGFAQTYCDATLGVRPARSLR